MCIRDSLYTEGGVTAQTTQAVTVQKASITVPSQSGSLTYTGSAQSPTWTDYDQAEMTLGGTTTGTGAGSYNATFTLKDTVGTEWADGTTEPKTVPWSIQKAAGSLSLNQESLTLDTNNPSKTITVTRAGTGAISAQCEPSSVASVSVSGNQITVTGLDSGSATVTVNVAADSNYNAPAAKTCSVQVSFSEIYGVEWDGTASTVWSRTDAAELFSDPSPAVNNGNGSSPFDTIMPWAGMVVEDDATAGKLVKIPKYWYKWTRSGNTMKLQISNGPEDGFLVSPAHADRGDGQGERDYVYVGRYPVSYTHLRALTPDAFGDEALFNWINQLEGQLASQVFLMAPAEVEQLHYTYPEEMCIRDRCGRSWRPWRPC